MNTQTSTKLPEATIQDVENIIDEFVKENRLFTKYDVTKMLRHRGFWAKHEAIRDIFESINLSDLLPDNYTSVLLKIGDPAPNLYLPDDMDAQMYDQYDIPLYKVSRKKTDTKTTVTISTPSDKGNDLFDVRGRFSVPAKDTRDAGFDKDDTVRILTNAGKIEITDDGSGNGRQIKVDRYFNIRVPKTDFENSFDDVPLAVKINISQNRIEIIEDSAA